MKFYRMVFSGIFALFFLATTPVQGADQPALSGAKAQQSADAGVAGSEGARKETAVTPLIKPKSEWKALLPPATYKVMFEEKTEPSGSSPLNAEKRDGTYICAACNQPLFESSTKFESGTGWPSFYDHIPGALATRKDYKLIWPRTEYHCSRCGGHQGHVFKDGPEPTHLRYCNNGEALHFVPKGEKLPELRQ
jgi:peptide-methionine (R)-S-oxide reductase